MTKLEVEARIFEFETKYGISSRRFLESKESEDEVRKKSHQDRWTWRELISILEELISYESNQVIQCRDPVQVGK